VKGGKASKKLGEDRTKVYLSFVDTDVRVLFSPVKKSKADRDRGHTLDFLNFLVFSARMNLKSKKA